MKELIGKRYNFLTITGTEKIGKKTHLLYLCDCGKTGRTYKYLVESGQTKSCGCYSRNLRVEQSRGRTDSRKEKGEAGKNRLYSQIKRSAETREIEFSLSKQEVISICEKNCHYCNQEPKTKSIGNSSSTYTEEGKEHAQFLYNGIDRVNNTIGYILSNVVPCCETCNKMKLTHELSDWINHMKKILKNLNI